MKNHLILGNWNALCDSCGRKFKALDLKKRWDGLMVCPEDWEMRHPQDFLRVQKEKINVEFSRPYPAQDDYIPYCTIEGSSGMPGWAEPGCAIPGRLYSITWDTIPSYCTIQSVNNFADIGAADCAVVGGITVATS